MKTDVVKKLNNQTRMAVSIIGSGLLLLAYMIIFEDEPGAVPLLMIVSGGVWFVSIRYRFKKFKDSE